MFNIFHSVLESIVFALTFFFIIGNISLIALLIEMLSGKFNFSKWEHFYWFFLFAFIIDLLLLLGIDPYKTLDSVLNLIDPHMLFKDDKDKVIKHNNNKNKERIEKEWQEHHKAEIKQETKIQNTFDELYEKEISNIVGNYSDKELESIKEVSFQNIVADKNMMKKIYENTNVDYKEIMKDYEIEERKRTKNHRAFEGRLATSDKNYLKSILGYKCMCCGLDLSELYGVLGNKYIELHHLIPYADLNENETRILNADDFAVLCPNCHRMIHRLDNPADINLLKKIIKN